MATPSVDGLKGPSDNRFDPENAKQLPGTQGRSLLVVNERLTNIRRELDHATQDRQLESVRAPD